jgi:hypothetical protein
MKDESEEPRPLDLSFISVHMLTCPARAQSCAATLARWDATDWGKAYGRPRIHMDDAPETADAAWGDARRGERIVAAFARMLDDATTLRGMTADQQRGLREKWNRRQWLLFLEDDLDLHPRIGAAVASWNALYGRGMATLFNPGLREIKIWADGQIDADGPPPTDSYLPPAVRLLRRLRDFPADPATFLGAQALLLNRTFARYALARWNTVTGMQSQRLAKLHVELCSPQPILVHRPSLVQHLPVEGGSGWGARVQQALDFDPAWQPPPAA